MFKSISLILVATLFGLGCNSTQTHDSADRVSPGIVNDACPISSKPLTADSPTTTWDGVTLGFCCNGCKKRFDAQTPAEKTAEVKDLTSGGSTVASNGKVNTVCPMTSRTVSSDSPTTTWDGVTLAFCCNGCKSRFDSMTAAEKNAEISKVTSAS